MAALITLQKTKEPLEKAAEAYISEEKGVESAKDAISGACDIIAESISDEAAYRTWIRETTMRKGKVTSQAKDPEAESVYEMYYEFEEACRTQNPCIEPWRERKIPDSEGGSTGRRYFKIS